MDISSGIEEKDFEAWKKDIESEPDFINRAEKMKITLMKGLKSKKDRDVFEDLFEYFKSKYERKKTFDLKSLYIYMTKVKGWPDFDYNVYSRQLTMIGLCGFNWKEV